MDVAPLRAAAGHAVVGTSVDRVRESVGIGRATTASSFRVASLTKPLTAVAVLRATQRAGIGLDAPVLDVLPGLRADWAADRDLTIAEVLAQTSGLAPTVSGDDIARLGDHDGVALDAARLVVRAGSIRSPGLRWEYYNGNYFLAGALVATLTGEPFEEAVESLVLRPWGLASTSFAVPPDLTPGDDRGRRVAGTAYPRGRRPSGGLCSTVEDVLSFGEHLLDEPDLLEPTRTARTRAGDPMRYGLGWALGPSGQLYLNGRLPGYRAALLLVPAAHLVGVVLAADSASLPAAARILSDLQRDHTGDDLTLAIDTFAA
ncbi:serine hydrolase domain-containing protein [Nocardioides plantarum]|uniref:serine hydrolase domain-containing protein n=1 Tax=Nocardioides plantarum TaxID=29299 RepID=UPI0024821436|nr:serine hydrolase domain-containing protein [Nocardioides plantarum]